MSVSVEQPPGEPEVHPAAWWLEEVRREERRGELLTAFDLAERGLEEHPDHVPLKHRAVLALARTGATEEAARRFEQYGLAAFRTRTSLRCERASPRTSRWRATAPSAGVRPVARPSCTARSTREPVATTLRSTRPRCAHRWRRPRERARDGRARAPAPAARTRTTPRPPRRRRTCCSAITPPRAGARRAAARHGGDYGAMATTRRQLRAICEVRGTTLRC